MDKVAALVVTYNRKEKLKKNLEHLLNQTYKLNELYIIDNNSNDGTYEYIESFIKDNKIIKYFKMKENLGGSGGFACGLKEILKNDKSDYIWGMDDDAYPNKDALEKIIEKKDDNNCYYSNSDFDKADFVKGIKEVNDWMFVGFFIPLNIVKKVGISRDDFFIYHDDSEYAYRIIKNGYKIKKVKDSIIFHDNNAAGENLLTKKFLGKEIFIPKIPNWKMYYFIRNNILMYKFNDLKRYKIVFYVMPKFLIRVMIINKKQIPIALKGYFHGIFNIKGKKETP